MSGCAGCSVAELLLIKVSEIQHSRVPLPRALGTGRGVSLRSANIICRRNIHDRANLSIDVTSGIGTGLCRVPGRVFQGCRGQAMQDLGYELPRIHIPRTRVNKGKKEGRSCYAPALN